MKRRKHPPPHTQDSAWAVQEDRCPGSLPWHDSPLYRVVSRGIQASPSEKHSGRALSAHLVTSSQDGLAPDQH